MMGSHKRGIATFLVVLLVLSLSLTLFSLADQTYLERSATRASLRNVQLRNSALSGIAFLKESWRENPTKSLHERIAPQDWKHLIQLDPEHPELIYRWARRIEKEKWIYGLNSESAKLNLYGLDLSMGSESLSRARLLALPGMTPQLADALLDWIDKDDIPRKFGAEAAWYSEQGMASVPLNGPLKSFRQLLEVRGFTESLVFGEDTNANGWLDLNEDDGDFSTPRDNQDGILDLGLQAYLSLTAFESNLDSHGELKIDLNDSILQRLFDRVQQAFGTEAATFVVAYRLDGPIIKEEEQSQDDLRTSLEKSLEERLNLQLYTNPLPPMQKLPQAALSRTRPGSLSLDRTPIHRIESIMDLIDTSVRTMVDGQERILESPWSFASANPHALWMELESKMAFRSESRDMTRIDITQAPLEVLMSIPGLPRSIAERLVALRSIGLSNDTWLTPYTLVDLNLLDVAALRKIARYLTTSGAIYSGYSVGRDTRMGSCAIVRIRLCCEGTEVRIQEQQDLGIRPCAIR